MLRVRMRHAERDEYTTKEGFTRLRVGLVFHSSLFINGSAGYTGLIAGFLIFSLFTLHPSARSSLVNLALRRFAATLLTLAAVFLASPGPALAEHEGKLQVLLLGDSTTIGSVCRQPNPAGPHLEDVIRVVLATQKDLPPANVINQGRDGEFIQGLLTGGRYDREIAKLVGDRKSVV